MARPGVCLLLGPPRPPRRPFVPLTDPHSWVGLLGSLWGPPRLGSLWGPSPSLFSLSDLMGSLAGRRLSRILKPFHYQRKAVIWPVPEDLPSAFRRSGCDAPRGRGGSRKERKNRTPSSVSKDLNPTLYLQFTSAHRKI